MDRFPGKVSRSVLVDAVNDKCANYQQLHSKKLTLSLRADLCTPKVGKVLFLYCYLYYTYIVSILTYGM